MPRAHRPKLVFVTGGVLSGLGKGITVSSIAKLFQSAGFDVTCLKIDPYLNFDAGTMRPTEHGEVFVTEDGYEADQDLGNYERFTDVNMSRDNNVTSGQVFWRVIEDERKGKFLGKTVQPIPHVTNEIKRRIMNVASKREITVVEVGGTVGDYENLLFLEAAKQLSLERSGDVAFAHVSYVPLLENVGELKTKPTQHSVKALRETGIEPGALIVRSPRPLDAPRVEKLALSSLLPANRVFAAPHVNNVYSFPIVLRKQGVDRVLLDQLGLGARKHDLDAWKRIVSHMDSARKSVRVGIVGKYVKSGDFILSDSYISVLEAVKHACAAHGAKPEIVWVDAESFLPERLRGIDCVIVPGGFGSSGVEGKIRAIKECRERNLPFLGLCFGFQLAVAEFARNRCGLRGANSPEVDPKTQHPVIDLLPEQEGVEKKGGTMRLGAYDAVLEEGSLVRKIYKTCGKKRKVVSERHRHRYEVNPEYIERLENRGLRFSGRSPDGKLMEFLELPGRRFFCATQAHPEFKSRPGKPAPLFYGLVGAALGKKI